MREYVDLHVHSTYSDGIYKPTEIVAMASKKSLRAIALADHDSVDGIDEAMAAGIILGVEVIPAVELSVAFNLYEDVHLLGYYLDHKDSKLLGKLGDFRKKRDQRGHAIIASINDKLAKENKGSISYEEALALADGALGRPHIARILMEKGFARDMQDAFTRYLLPCNVPKQYFPVAEALSEIRRLRGVAVLAHPTSISDDKNTLRTIIGELASMGLDGIEAVNNMSNRDESTFLKKLARDKGLLITGGSDFHGIEGGIEVGICWGGASVPYGFVEDMRLHRERFET